MSTQAALGQKALEAKDYSNAIKYYTEALKSSNSPLWLTQRSTAYQREGAHELALHDAENAVLAAISRGKRELIAAAQMRRAIALYSLGRYGDARLCFTWTRKLNEKEKGLGMWQAKVVAEFDKLDEEAEGKKVTIKEIPDKVERVAKEPEPGVVKTSGNTPAADTHIPANATSGAVTTATPAQTPKDKIRHEWFQSNSKVTITIFAKNVPKDQADIQIGAQSLDVTFPTSSGSNYDFTLLPLFAAIDQSQSTYSIMSTKIEIILHKTTSGLKWPTLEGTALTASNLGDPKNDDSTTSSESRVEAVSDHPAPDKPPAYPTSSRKGAKNWDAVASEALKKEKGDVKDGETPSNDDDGIDDEGDPLQGFFKKLYKDANPDTRRAMMKSYVESNGTALSTDWDDVGKKTVPVNPPDGIEAKKWES